MGDNKIVISYIEYPLRSLEVQTRSILRKRGCGGYRQMAVADGGMPDVEEIGRYRQMAEWRNGRCGRLWQREQLVL